jgi:alkylhydroperoxidase/carboxymuconolactone decarboxylase family protein YurZ
MSPREIGVDVTHEQLELLRRLALSDPGALAKAAGDPTLSVELLDAQTRALVRVAAVVALDAGGPSCRAVVDDARAAGVDDEAIGEVISAIGAYVGRTGVDEELALLGEP